MTASRTSIRAKLVAAMMLTSTVALLLVGAALVLFDVVSFRQSLATALTTRARVLAANATAALAFRNDQDATHILAALHSDPSTVAAALYDREGRLFATYPAEAGPAAVPPAPRGLGHRFERAGVVVEEAVVEEGRTLGTLYLESDLRALSRRLRVSILVVLLAMVGSIGVAFMLATWLQADIARPVRTLAAAARKVSETRDYTTRADVVSDDELGPMAEAFNAMLAEIQLRDAERHRSEQEIRQLNASLERRVALRTAELEASNRELESFSYSVSHDLRAPLRHIDGFADLLTRHANEGLDEKARRYLATISESARRMGTLIDDLLAFSRMGRSEMKDAPVRLDELVAQVRAELAPDVGDRTITWIVTPLPEVHGDRAMLKVVFTNLISNAIKYTRGTTPATIAIGAEERDHETIVFVQDDGAGFDMAYQHKLFGVFQRLHSADEFEGTGIGLANVQRIVQRHGGRVWAEGEVGRGATFFVALPRSDEGRHHREAA